MTSNRDAMPLERQAFEEWFESWNDPHVGIVETQIKKGAAWAAWQHLSRAAEPVAEIGPCWSLRYCGNDSIATLAKRHNLQTGTKLYTLPPEPARDANNKPWTDSEKEHMQAAAELVAERERLAKDVARYRYVRVNLPQGTFGDADVHDADSWDEAIDAAMAQEPGE